MSILSIAAAAAALAETEAAVAFARQG
ncbi:unnamed protein product, partial [Adineta steineri]